MKAWKFFNRCVLVLMVLFSQQLLIAKAGKSTKTIAKPTILHYTQFDANNICNWIGNTGEVVSYNVTGNAGLEWPKGSGLTAVFQSGIWIAGLVDGQIRSAAAEYTSEYQPGNVSYNPDAQNPEAGIPNDPNLARFKIYTINKGDSPDPASPAYNPDYANWPVADGAPAHDGEYFTDSNENEIYDSGEEFEDFDLDGVYDAPDGQLIEGEDPPLLLGDQTHWSVSNDFGPEHGNLFCTDPLGIELQTTIFGFESNNLDDVMFVKWLIINKSGRTIDDCYNAIWSDPDVGDATDDYVGCDTALSVGYAYNGNEIDQVYGYAVPCVGYDYFQGPVIPSMGDTAHVSGEKIPDFKNLPMTSFVAYWSGTNDFPDPESPVIVYNYMRSLKYDGSVWTDPTGNPSSFVFTGDPLTGNGWIASDDFNPGDKRFLMSSGPFTMETWTDENGDERAQVGEPGVQEIVMAILIGRGSNYLKSIPVMKDLDRIAQSFYTYGNERPKITLTAPVAGETYSDIINIEWEDNQDFPVATHVIIEFSDDNGMTWSVIDELTDNPGSYQWDITNQPDASQAKIRITGYIKSDQIGRVENSAAFAIDNPNYNAEPEIWDLVQEFRYEIILSGDYEIHWTAGDPDNSELDISLEFKNLYEDWHVIADDLGETDSWVWHTKLFPNTTDGGLRLKVNDGTNETIAEIPHNFRLKNERNHFIPVEQISGVSQSIVNVVVIDSLQTNQHEYEIQFHENDTLKFSVSDLTTDSYVLQQLPIIDKHNESPVFDGLTLNFDSFDHITFSAVNSGWISGDCNWGFNMMPEGTNYFVSNYEIRFTESGSTDINGVQAPFEVWNASLEYYPDFMLGAQTETTYVIGIYEEPEGVSSTIVWAVSIFIISSDDSVPPENGDILYLFVGSPFTEEDIFRFTNNFVKVEKAENLPTRFTLLQNYPNPFNPTTTISYELPKELFTEIRIYNLAGQLVQTLLNEVKPTGQHQIIWNAGDLPSGIYFYQIKVEDTAGSGVQTKKCILLK